MKPLEALAAFFVLFNAWLSGPWVRLFGAWPLMQGDGRDQWECDFRDEYCAGWAEGWLYAVRPHGEAPFMVARRAAFTELRPGPIVVHEVPAEAILRAEGRWVGEFADVEALRQALALPKWPRVGDDSPASRFSVYGVVFRKTLLAEALWLLGEDTSSAWVTVTAIHHGETLQIAGGDWRIFLASCSEALATGMDELGEAHHRACNADYAPSTRVSV